MPAPTLSCSVLPLKVKPWPLAEIASPLQLLIDSSVTVEPVEPSGNSVDAASENCRQPS